MNLAYAGQTLGLSNTFIFWKIRMPACRQGILAGIVLAFARALGEYGATSMLIGYTPGKTATISTTVYQLWRTNDDAGAFQWVMVNLGHQRRGAAGGQHAGNPSEKGGAQMSLSVHIEKDLGDFHLRADLETTGGVFGVLGASGCGKSYTLKCIAGIETPDRGSIVLDGVTLFDAGKGVNLRPQQRRGVFVSELCAVS